uniref:Reverse transcriptase domain-containing protein n=1 Tax=Tanacetum cinerariifolium TaxID=118510 RepID=A0A6L2MR04_TANCI|nr:hypothetical protein [Tanacetum cinerariifolium]
MSDSEDSTVTYIEVSSPFEGLSDMGSSGVNGLPMMPEDPYAYIEAPLQALSSPDYDDVLPAEEQSLPAADSPTADSLGCIPESDPEKDDEDPEEDPADYPTDRDDDDEEEEEESSGDKADDEEWDEDEEHPAPTDFIPPLTVHRTTARIYILVQAPTPFWSEAEIDRLLVISSPPPSPLSLWSSPLPHIPSPPLPDESRGTIYFTSTTTYCTSTYQGICGHAETAAPSTYILAPRSETPPSGTPPLLPIHLPTSSPHLLLPFASHKADVPEVTLSPRKRLCIALGLRYEVGESSSAPTARTTRGFRADYDFVVTLDDEIRREPKKLGRRMTDFVTTIRQDTDEIYGRLDNKHDDRLLMSGQLNMLRRDRRYVITYYSVSTTVKDCRMAGSSPHMTDTASRGTDSAKDTTDTDGSIAETTNSHVKTAGPDVAYAMTWTNLKKKMTDKYCPMGEIKKLEVELWNLNVKESDKIERYIGGLPDMI